MTNPEKSKPGLLFIVSAPTGGGKTTLVTNALLKLQKKFHIERLVTFTTRAMRENEKSGVDYHFVDRETFLMLEKSGCFFEVTTYNGNLYGSPQEFLNQIHQGKSFIVITDRKGIVSCKKRFPNAISLWISPPSFEELKQRLQKRSKMSNERNEDLDGRLNIAQAEMAAEKTTPLCQYEIINTTITQATEELVTLMSKYLTKE